MIMLMLRLLQIQGIRRVHNHNHNHKHKHHRPPYCMVCYWHGKRPAGCGVLRAWCVCREVSSVAASPVLGDSPQTVMVYIVVGLVRMGLSPARSGRKKVPSVGLAVRYAGVAAGGMGRGRERWYLPVVVAGVLSPVSAKLQLQSSPHIAH